MHNGNEAQHGTETINLIELVDRIDRIIGKFFDVTNVDGSSDMANDIFNATDIDRMTVEDLIKSGITSASHAVYDAAVRKCFPDADSGAQATDCIPCSKRNQWSQLDDLESLYRDLPNETRESRKSDSMGFPRYIEAGVQIAPIPSHFGSEAAQLARGRLLRTIVVGNWAAQVIEQDAIDYANCTPTSVSRTEVDRTKRESHEPSSMFKASSQDAETVRIDF